MLRQMLTSYPPFQGIGIETARALYETGATLFLTARDMSKLESVIEDIVKNAEHKNGPRPQGIKMSLESLDSVREGVEDFKQKSGGRLNILINNAGIMAAPYGQTQDGFENQIGVNHIGHYLLFQLVKPCLLASAKESGSDSRVISLSSAGHQWCGLKFSNKAEFDAWNNGSGYDKWQSYGQAKTSNIYLASSITRHYRHQHLLAWAVHPGGIMTELGRHVTAEDFEAFGGFEEMQKGFKSPPQGAATTVRAAISPHFEGNQDGVRYLADVGEASPKQGDAALEEGGYAAWAFDAKQEEMLWKISYEAVGMDAEE